MAKNNLPVGTVVRISEGSGYLSGKVGRIASYSDVKTDGRGIPKIKGCYAPMNASKEVPLYVDGELVLMFKNRLTVENQWYDNIVMTSVKADGPAVEIVR